MNEPNTPRSKRAEAQPALASEIAPIAGVSVLPFRRFADSTPTSHARGRRFETSRAPALSRPVAPVAERNRERSGSLTPNADRASRFPRSARGTMSSTLALRARSASGSLRLLAFRLLIGRCRGRRLLATCGCYEASVASCASSRTHRSARCPRTATGSSSSWSTSSGTTVKDD